MFKIVCLYPFRHSCQSALVTQLRHFLPGWNIDAPDIPVDPREALPFLRQYCEQQQPQLILGIAIGGMYTQLMRGYNKFLVNPVFDISFADSKDLPVALTDDMKDAFHALESTQFDNLTFDDLVNTFALFGTECDNVYAYNMFKERYHFGCSARAICYMGGQLFSDDIMKYVVLPLIHNLLSCTYNQRRIVNWNGYTIAVDDNVMIAAIQSTPQIKSVSYNVPADIIIDGKCYCVTSIDMYGLSDVEADEVCLPDSITYLDECFIGLESKCKRVILGNGLSGVHHWAFPHKNKVDVSIGDKNPFLIIENGVIYTIDHKILLAIVWYDKPELVVPDGVEEIGNAAISCNNYIERIKLPSTLKVIQVNGIFELCNLKELVIPKSIRQIQHQGVSFCETLEKLYVPSELDCEEDECFESDGNVQIIRY